MNASPPPPRLPGRLERLQRARKSLSLGKSLQTAAALNGWGTDQLDLLLWKNATRDGLSAEQFARTRTLPSAVA